jgi:hypothetical protein
MAGKGNPDLKPRWTKGQSGNPSGRPKGQLRRDQVEAVMGRFSAMTRAELQKIVQNEKSTMLEIMVASVMAKAAKDGDATRLQFLLDRTIGRVKEQVEISTPTPYVIERLDGSQIEMGMMLPAPDEEPHGGS